MSFPSDDDTVLSSGETMRQAKSRGGKQKKIKSLELVAKGKKGRRPNESKEYNWPGVLEMWMTGRYSKIELAEMFGIPYQTLKSESHRKRWPPRPIGYLAQQALPSLVEAASPGASPETVEQLLAGIEGRSVDEEASDRERAAESARRKSRVLARHRNMADKYMLLAVKTMELLSSYADGTLKRSYVETTDPDGKKVNIPMNLISKTHGLADGVYRVGMIAQTAVKLDRLAHALENVDGDGNPIKADGAGGGGFTGLTNSELDAKLKNLLSALDTPVRITPVPPGLLNPFGGASPSIPVVQASPAAAALSAGLEAGAREVLPDGTLPVDQPSPAAAQVPLEALPPYRATDPVEGLGLERAPAAADPLSAQDLMAMDLDGDPS